MPVLDGQKAIITGASTGVGAAIARAFAAAGATLGINYHSGGAKAAALVNQLRERGAQAVALEADVSHERDVRSMFDRFVDAFGRVDIVVANAGIQKDAALCDMSLADWNKVIDVNLCGQFLCLREAARRFLAQDGSPVSKAAGKIICISSVHQRIPWAGHVNYAASKGGVMMLMKSVAQELAARKVRVNSIAPGAIRTDINRDAWNDPEALKKLLALIPYGRVGDADDVAKAAVWLASDESDYVTGSTLYVDGGMRLYPGFVGNG